MNAAKPRKLLAKGSYVVIPVPLAKSQGSSLSLEVPSRKPQRSSESAGSAEMEDVPQPRPRRNSLLVPRKGAKSRSIYTSVDAATWTQQLKADIRAPHEKAKRMEVPSMLQMDSAFMRAISTPHQLVPLSSTPFRGVVPPGGAPAAAAAPAKRLSRLSSASESALAGDGHDPLNLPGAPDAKQATLQTADSGKKKSSTVMSLSKDSQANILDHFHESMDSPLRTEISHDLSSRILLSLPCILCPMLGLLTLCYCGLLLVMLLTTWLSGSTMQATLISVAVYSAAACGCTHFLRRALRTDELMLALGKLHMFVADFQVEWSKVSGQEWRKNGLMWVLVVWFFAAGQLLEELQPLEASSDPAAPDPEVLLSLRRALSIVSVAIFAISSALVILGSSVLSHILMGLDKSLDCWCCILLDEGDFVIGVQSWNCLQALLKCIGRELGNAFVMTQALGAVGLVYFLTSAVTTAFHMGFRFAPSAVSGD
ncbi:unnamed protein product [Symbiodinium natans]|uniref:Uncharacterized protein n=1 Tax=Symbiodinium natans TaxID=878477 RepID=A0A812LWL5_9DINO|nr:unnamed protein product [Symbiodinium natans]